MNDGSRMVSAGDINLDAWKSMSEASDLKFEQFGRLADLFIELMKTQNKRVLR